MKNFFVSYTSVDRGWATWVAFVLEENGYTTILQEWDFRPGMNFPVAMQKAANEANRTIMVLSPAYLESGFASSEWAAAFVKDPKGLEQKLLPVVVTACEPGGVLSSIVHIDLTGKNEAEARAELLAGVKGERAKPKTRPPFPGQTGTPNFPGAPSQAPARSDSKIYMPKVRRALTDMEKRAFLRDTFGEITRYFDTGLQDLKSHAKDLETDFQKISAVEITAEIFSRGQSVSACRIRHGNGGFGNDTITFSHGRETFHTTGANEILSVTDSEGEPLISSMMGGIGFGRQVAFDPKRMAPGQAAEYLWRMFVARLEY